VSGRTYLSIGDVLTLLREEFPDVTISKIRFLESQGLVNPERSPSGYRKFFEADVERLRWVLRQQREHFLPLKVIRDRLSEGDLGEDVGPATIEVGEGAEGAEDVGDVGAPVAQPARRNGKVPQPAHAAAGATASSGSGSGPSSGPTGAAAAPGRTQAQLAKADDEAMARILADASRRAAMKPESPTERAPLRVVGDAEDPAPAPVPARAATASAPDPAPAPAPADTAPPPTADARRAEQRSRAAATTGMSAPATPAATAAPRASEPARPKAAAPAAPAGKGDGSGAAKGAPAKVTTPSGLVTGVSMTAEELCSASGLSEIELASLQGFGLVEATEVAGILTFNEEALTVANLAAEFRKFGIEARHLRLYRNAVDREMGLIEQVIIPLLRQRNPESRQRAVENADELGTLGQTMRATLLRSALRRHVGG
jgi:DNA-binding transcriptional MerR regulator